MADVICKKQGRIKSCSKLQSFEVAGSKTAKYCTQPSTDSIVDVKKGKCISEGCGKRLPSEVANTRTVEHCRQHSTFDVAGTRKKERCAHHTTLQCCAEVCKGRPIRPHSLGKEAIGNASPSGAKKKTVHPLPAQANLPSGSAGSLVSVNDT